MTPLYTPSPRLAGQSLLRKYMDWLFVKKGLYFRDYDDLWDWSVTDLEDFWESLWQFFDVQSHTPYHQVLYRPTETDMIGTEWFSESTLNYAEHIFRHKPLAAPGQPSRLAAAASMLAGGQVNTPAILYASERRALAALSWVDLEQQVAAVSTWLRQQGVGVGDRVVSVLPNIPQAVVAFLAANAVGAIWSICSPDFSTASIVERFSQLKPVILIVADGYTYNGIPTNNTEAMLELRTNLPTLRQVVWLPYLNETSKPPSVILWNDVLQTPAPDGLLFEPVPFSHPIWVLYSSGTGGKPKAITHSVGGCLLEHLKVLTLHQDVRVGERYFWHSTTSWMMWNFTLGSMLAGATLVLYDGAPAYPTPDTLWNLAEQARITHFGGSAPYFTACMRAGIRPADTLKLPYLRTIGSTGSLLAPQEFRWIYDAVKADVWLSSFGVDTDVCSGFVGGNPLLPVYEGEIQCRLLGCKVDAFDEQGRSVRNAPAEMVVLEPMPSMPLSFWNDPDNARYRSTYFGAYAGIWQQGDLIRITERNSVIICGRMETALNRDGVRIGTAEIYSTVEQIDEIADSLVVGIEQPGGVCYMPLFVVLRAGSSLTDELITRIKHRLRTQFSPRHVPDAIYQIQEIPYTVGGKKLETAVRKILGGMAPSLVMSRYVLRNPASLDQFVDFIVYFS